MYLTIKIDLKDETLIKDFLDKNRTIYTENVSNSKILNKKIS